MVLSDSLVWALEHYNISGIKVLCEESICDDIAQSFMTDFSNRWKNALLEVEDEHGDCIPADVPAKIVKKDYGFFISIGALDIRYAYGDCYDADYSFNALNCALKNMKTAYPQIKYEGYICGVLCDRWSGDVFQEEAWHGRRPELYDFVGEALGNILASEVYVPEKPIDADYVNFVVAGRLKFFKNRKEISGYIEGLGGNVTGSISEETDYLISNDLNAASSKIAKAKELGIPIISEAEFIGMFGKPRQFGLETSLFWDCLSGRLYSKKEFDQTIKVLYAYSDWIRKADLERAVRAIIHIAGECEVYEDDKYECAEELQEELVELVKQLESGEYVDEVDVKDTVADNLPDGYMEALEMFMMAEDISGIRPLPGEVISSKGTFDIVIAQAEAGDANAKLTAGKYFIADHIEGEIERAIQWIQEASDAGIEEATEYIHSHCELFNL